MAPRSAVMVAVAVLCAAGGTLALVHTRADEGQGPPSPPASSTSLAAVRHESRASGSKKTRGPLMARSLPVHLDIPAVHIDTGLLRLGLNPDGTLQVPEKPLLAGWYIHSPTPGELGPAVIAGHVDSVQTGPAVFYRLGQVATGDQVRVARADGSVAVFRVTTVSAFPKAAFPTRLVYGDVNRAELRVITCGTWNAATQEYDDNVVVFARLVGSRSTPGDSVVPARP